MCAETIHLTLDGQAIEAPAGTTVLNAARQVGVRIPTLCHLAQCDPYTSCMVCAVWDAATQKMIPACSARVSEGMRIRTDTDAVREARRAVLDLLLSEHVGDCEAPCRLACPAYMDIPAMLRALRAGGMGEAAAIVKEHIPLPAILGRICPAPCEKACRRGALDDAVAICLLKRFVGDVDLEQPAPWLPVCAPESGYRVAVVGAGPAGLSAAWFLRRAGHACVVYEREERAGGTLRSAIARDLLPESVLDREIGQIARMGLTWRTGVTLGAEVSLAALRREFDAVVLAVGECTEAQCRAWGLPGNARGVAVDRHTLAVDAEGLFAMGACVRPTRMAVRSVAEGHTVAASVATWLGSAPVPGATRRFTSRIGRLSEAELRECMQEAEPLDRQTAEPTAGFGPRSAAKEAARCLRCDCRAKEDCVLRAFSEEYEARQRRYPIDERPELTKTIDRNGTILETGKCIKCGKCVRLCAAAGAPAGLAFLGRGLDVRVGVPFGEDFSTAPEELVRACIDACPTGALARGL